MPPRQGDESTHYFGILFTTHLCSLYPYYQARQLRQSSRYIGAHGQLNRSSYESILHWRLYRSLSHGTSTSRTIGEGKFA